MRAGKGNQEEDEYEEEEFGSKKPGASSNSTSISNNNISASNNKDGKSNDKANAIRSKHSVTEQRRRSKINERFQILRDLIPHTDQKRDTASFLLEVIEYVQFLQEKVQKYQGTYQGWSSEPTKLMPWRNSHWRSQSFVSPSPALKNGSGPGPTFPGRFDENNINATMCAQSQVESDPSRDVTPKGMDTHSELANKAMPVPIPPPIRCDGMLAHPMQKPVPDTQSTECPITSSVLNQQEELTIEGGIISVSSVYSQELLNSLTQALQSTGIDLSQANISVQIDLGKRTNRGLMCGSSTGKDFQNSSNQAMMHLRDVSSGEDSDPAQKRQKK